MSTLSSSSMLGLSSIITTILRLICTFADTFVNRTHAYIQAYICCITLRKYVTGRKGAPVRPYLFLRA